MIHFSIIATLNNVVINEMPQMPIPVAFLCIYGLLKLAPDAKVCGTEDRPPDLELADPTIFWVRITYTKTTIFNAVGIDLLIFPSVVFPCHKNAT